MFRPGRVAGKRIGNESNKHNKLEHSNDFLSNRRLRIKIRKVTYTRFFNGPLRSNSLTTLHYVYGISAFFCAVLTNQ